jgi:hypothetical protein
MTTITNPKHEYLEPVENLAWFIWVDPGINKTEGIPCGCPRFALDVRPELATPAKVCLPRVAVESIVRSSPHQSQ